MRIHLAGCLRHHADRLGYRGICNFSATGKDLLQFYDQSDVIKNLVHYSLISGLVKIALGILATGIFLFIWKKHYF